MSRPEQAPVQAFEQRVRRGVDSGLRAVERLLAGTELRVVEAAEGEPAESDARTAIVVRLAIQGRVLGRTSLLFPASAAQALAASMIGRSAPELDELAVSALSEVGNVVASGVAHALAEGLEGVVIPTPPQVEHGPWSGLCRGLSASWAPDARGVTFRAELSSGPWFLIRVEVARAPTSFLGEAGSIR